MFLNAQSYVKHSMRLKDKETYRCHRHNYVDTCNMLSMDFLFSSCECTESRLSSSRRHRRAPSHIHHHRRRHRHHRSRLATTASHTNAQTSAPLSTFTSTSYRSGSLSDELEEEEEEGVEEDEDQARGQEDNVCILNPNQTQYLSSVSNLMGHLPQPDLVQSTINDEYCHHLQQMADLSNQQRYNEQSMPFFGQDDHICNTEHSTMPTSSLEKTLLFHQ
jgi:hypothetical protein